jgi:hypothetical protein
VVRVLQRHFAGLGAAGGKETIIRRLDQRLAAEGLSMDQGEMAPTGGTRRESDGRLNTVLRIRPGRLGGARAALRPCPQAIDHALALPEAERAGMGAKVANERGRIGGSQNARARAVYL